MKKYIVLLLALLPYTLQAMKLSKLKKQGAKKGIHVNSGFQGKKKYSTKKPTDVLNEFSVSELKNLARSKETAEKVLTSALMNYQDTHAATKQLSSEEKKLWAHILSQQPVSFWHMVLLQREEHKTLTTVNQKLPSIIAKFDFAKVAKSKKNIKKDNRAHKEMQKEYRSKPFSTKLQDDYKQKLEAHGYPPLSGNIYVLQCFQDYAAAMQPHIYINPTFCKLPIKERLAILGHEDQHNKNYHQLKEIAINAHLGQDETPTIISQFMEKEADIKACILGGILFTQGLSEFFERHRKRLEDIHMYKLLNNEPRTHPNPSKRIAYLEQLESEQKKEKQGYALNPFAQTLGLDEWLQK